MNNYEHTLSTLKRIKNEYPSLFECYSPVDGGEAAELGIPYYYAASMKGCFELLGGNTLLDESNRVVMHKLLSNQSVVAYEHTYLCNSVSLYLDIETVEKLSDNQLQFIEDILSSLEQYPALDDEHYSNLQHEYANEQWLETSLQDRINAIVDANEYSDDVVSILAARRDSVPRNVFNHMLDMGELN